MKQARKLLSFALTVGVVGSLAVPAIAASYRDVEGHWAKNAIMDLSGRDVISGYQDGYFRPNRLVTRAEFTDMLVRAMGYDREPVRRLDRFSDLDRDHWAWDSIQRASAHNLLIGYPDDNFNPDGYITRGEVLRVLAGVIEGETPDAEKTELILKRFHDAHRLSDELRTPVAKAAGYRIFRHSKSVNPNQRVTRGEMAVLLDNMIEYNELANKPTIEIYHTWDEVVENKPVEINVPPLAPKTKPTFTTTVATALSSEYTEEGDEVTLILNEPIVTPGGDVAPSGSRVIGTVIDVQPAEGDEMGMLKVRFSEIWTPANQRLQVSGTVGTRDGYLKAGDTDNRKVLRRAGNSYEGLKAKVNSAIGAVQKNLKSDVYSVTHSAGTYHNRQVMEANRDSMVLVGVGDRLEVKFDGATHYEDRF